MGWVTTGDVVEFLEAAGPFLRAERARNTILLTVSENVRLNPGRYGAWREADPAWLPLFGWWINAGPSASPATGPSGSPAIGGAFLHTPPFPLLLSGVSPGAAADLAATLAGRPLAGVNAHRAPAAAFAGVWSESTGCEAEVHRRTRLYRLAELTWPDPVPDGAPRTPAPHDVGQLTDWLEAFSMEVNEMPAADHAAAARDALSYGGLTLWESGGTPVSMAGLTRQVAGMVRVGQVYTPPRLRGRGYASAVTAEVSRAALAAGAEEVLLFTDLANPVSNSIYQHIGYREVEDRVVLTFTER
jgi:GNAT superfamily N-acetyltransferase